MNRYEIKTYMVDTEKTLYSVDQTEAPSIKRAITNIKYKLFGTHRKGSMCSIDGGFMFHNFDFEVKEITG